MSSRRGFTLVELLVVMSIGSVLLGTAATLTYTLLVAHKTVRSQMQDGASRGRLAEQFRRDVHAATAVAPLQAVAGTRRVPSADHVGWLGSSGEERATSPQIAEPWGLASRPSGPDPSHPTPLQAVAGTRRVPTTGWVFRLDEQRTVRYVGGPRRIVRSEYRGDKILGRDTFLLSDGTTATIEVDPKGKPPMVRLRIDRAPARTTSIGAVLGRDHRFRENKVVGTRRVP